MKKGLLMVYTGSGEGHTATALGQTFRALGAGLRVCFIRFTSEPTQSDEPVSADRFHGRLEVRALGAGVGGSPESSRTRTAAGKEAWAQAKRIVESGEFNLVVLEDLIRLINDGTLDEREVIAFLKARPEMLHIIVTGADASPVLVEAADLVTDIRELKDRTGTDLKTAKGSNC